jgi:2-polyprenyl-3-methyl-5-hydroxy-6-metoxy-1,4-benzoquinol methylase
MQDSEQRFAFGKNWEQFVQEDFSPERVDKARARLLKSLRLEDLNSRTFLDIGCGSGIHSLAALQAGAAKVISFDYDADSVQTTQTLRNIAGNPDHWTVRQGSVLDEGFMRSLETADIVYSWGVLHHTGKMWDAIKNACIPLKRDGVLFIALYSYTTYMNGTLRGQPSPEQWLAIKQRYNRASATGKRVMETQHLLRDTFAPLRIDMSTKLPGQTKKSLFRRVKRTVVMKLNDILPAAKSMVEGVAQKIHTLRHYERDRGMSYWTDVRDWLGGWPMEFVKEDEFIVFCRDQLGLEPLMVVTGEGNSEFALRYKGVSNYWDETISRRLFRKLEPPFEKGAGRIWVALLTDLAERADTVQTPARSEIQLLEDGTWLPFGHSPHVSIERLGGGRFSHWGERFFFSTSDNSDPNTNGRIYSIVYEA